MHFKIDENLPVEAAELLRSSGHEATTVLEQNLRGRPDPDIACVCQRDGLTLVTLDTGFGATPRRLAFFGPWAQARVSKTPM